jgi:hypothetical protein
MKKTLFLALIGLALIGQSLLPGLVLAQTIPTTRAYRMPWQDPFTMIYPTTGVDIKLPFGDRLNWETGKSSTWADVSTAGIADTAWGDTIVYYGQLISTKQMDSWPRIAIIGLDSGTVSIDYRWMAYNANTIASGAWSSWSSAAVLTVPREYTKGKGGGRDTLVVPLLQMTDTDSTANFFATETGFMQFRYTFISMRTHKVAEFKTFIDQPRPGFNYTWRGEAIITARRTNQ